MKLSGLLASTFIGLTTVAIAGQPTTAHASTAKITTIKTYQVKPTYLARYTKTAYMWNTHYTKAIHNLKNYPHTTLYATKKVTIKSKKHTATYYYVQSANKKVAGYVWHGYLIAGHYVSGGYYSYPSRGILLSSLRYQSQADDSLIEEVYVPGTKDKTALSDFATTPTTKQMVKVLSFYLKNPKNTDLPAFVRSSKTANARIALVNVWPTSNKADVLRIPMFQVMPKQSEMSYFGNRTNFWAMQDLVALGAKPEKTYPMKATSGSTTTGIGIRTVRYNFPDETANALSNSGGNLQAVYGDGYGKKHDLSLVALDGWLRYVNTSDLPD
jgi:hypothetical protein